MAILSSVEDLQQMLVVWHKKRFPNAEPEHVAMKLGSEAGEVLDAMLGLLGAHSATGKGKVGEEVADVFIAGLVLLGRWYPNIDIVEEMLEKLSILTDGDHPASLKFGGE